MGRAKGNQTWKGARCKGPLYQLLRSHVGEVGGSICSKTLIHLNLTSEIVAFLIAKSRSFKFVSLSQKLVSLNGSIVKDVGRWHKEGLAQDCKITSRSI